MLELLVSQLCDHGLNLPVLVNAGFRFLDQLGIVFVKMEIIFKKIDANEKKVVKKVLDATTTEQV